MTDADKAVIEDPEYAYVSEDDSPEMKELNQEERHRTSARSKAGRLDVPSGRSPPLESAMAMLKYGYTVAVSGLLSSNILGADFAQGYGVR